MSTTTDTTESDSIEAADGEQSALDEAINEVRDILSDHEIQVDERSDLGMILKIPEREDGGVVAHGVDTARIRDLGFEQDQIAVASETLPTAARLYYSFNGGDE